MVRKFLPIWLMNLSRALYLFCVFPLCMSACTDTKVAAPLMVEAAYVKALAPNQTSGAVFTRITNNSNITQALNYVHSPIADYIEIRRSIYTDGVKKSIPVKRLSVNPKQTETLRSGGYYLMLHGIYDNLAPGSRFDITFEFESGEVIMTQVEVRARG